MDFPEELKYTEEHEWVLVEGDLAALPDHISALGAYDGTGLIDPEADHRRRRDTGSELEVEQRVQAYHPDAA